MFRHEKGSRLSTNSRLLKYASQLLLLPLALFLSVINAVYAQDQTGPLIGNWEVRKVSMHVEFKSVMDENGQPISNSQYAVITRSDWSPHRVGKTLYKNVVNIGKKRWRGEEVDDKGIVRTVRFRLKSDGKLHTTSFLDGRQNIEWTSNEI